MRVEQLETYPHVEPPTQYVQANRTVPGVEILWSVSARVLLDSTSEVRTTLAEI